jgi:hypothetical protein
MPDAGAEKASGSADAPALSRVQEFVKERDDLRERAEKLRGRVDFTAKALAGLGTTVVSAAGIARIGDIFPIPPGEGSHDWAKAAVIGFVAIGVALFIFTYRLWSVHQPMFMGTDPEEMYAAGDLDRYERDEVHRVYQEVANLNGIPTLRAYEARSQELQRIADQAADEKEKSALLERAALIKAEISATMARASLRVLRRRTTNAVRGIGAVFAYGVLISGIVVFALGTDYVASERNEQVTIAKNCADARDAGATDATLPAICGKDPAEEEPEQLSAEEELANAANGLMQPLSRCLALVRSGDAPAGSCDPLRDAAAVLLGR